MATKVLVSAIGQHIIAEVKQVENKETKEIIAYWLKNPRTVSYSVDDENQVNVSFGQFCVISNETEFSVRADHIVSILEPRPEVEERYTAIVYPQETAVAEVTELTELTETEAPVDESESADS